MAGEVNASAVVTRRVGPGVVTVPGWTPLESLLRMQGSHAGIATAARAETTRAMCWPPFCIRYVSQTVQRRNAIYISYVITLRFILVCIALTTVGAHRHPRRMIALPSAPWIETDDCAVRSIRWENVSKKLVNARWPEGVGDQD